MLRAATARVAAVRADVAMKPVDVTGYEEPVRLLAPEVVEPFETLVVKARTKIAFTAGHLRCSTLAMDSKDGALPPGLIVTGAYTVLKRGSKTVPVVLRNTTGVAYHPQERAEGCPSTGCKRGTSSSLETGNLGVVGNT